MLGNIQGKRGEAKRASKKGRKAAPQGTQAHPRSGESDKGVVNYLETHPKEIEDLVHSVRMETAAVAVHNVLKGLSSDDISKVIGQLKK